MATAPNVAVQALARSASEAEREGRVACNRGLCGFWLEKTGIARLAVNRLTERSRAAVSPKAESVILNCVVVGAPAGQVAFP